MARHMGAGIQGLQQRKAMSATIIPFPVKDDQLTERPRRCVEPMECAAMGAKHTNVIRFPNKCQQREIAHRKLCARI
jgi:hypothetical protein